MWGGYTRYWGKQNGQTVDTKKGGREVKNNHCFEKKLIKKEKGVREDRKSELKAKKGSPHKVSPGNQVDL